MSAEPASIPEELVELFESGVSLLVGTRDAALRPACSRAVGVRVAPDRRSLTVYLADATSERTLANVRDNGRIALTFSRMVDNRTYQIKGACLAVRASEPAERPLQQRYVLAWSAELEAVGMPRALSSSLVWWPSKALEVRVEAVFQQTPGPAAGRRLEDAKS